MRTYAIGDIHGQLGKLQAAHALIAADRAATGDAEAPVVHLGDLVDRGPDSRAVIALLMAGQAAGQPWIVIKGNHDRLFTRFFADPAWLDPRVKSDLHWLNPRLGGGPTLGSYGVPNAADRPLPAVIAEARERVPAAHLDWLRDLPLYHVRDELLFVHAGILPGVDLRCQTEDDLLWIRAGFLEDGRDHGALVVHGHTALSGPANYGNRVNLDSGAGYDGPLTAAVFEGREAFVLTARGRRPLPAIATAD